MCTMDRSRCPDPRKRHRTASAFENAELGDDKAADVTTYTARSNKMMPRDTHCVSTPAATDAGTFDAVMQTEHPESPPRQPPSAPVRDASGPIQKEEPQNAALQVADPARNRHHWHHHHHRYLSPAKSRRGHHHALCGSSRQTSAAPAAPPYPSACHDRQQYPVATRGMPRMTKFGRPPMPCGRVQTAAGAMHQPPRVIGPRLYNSRNKTKISTKLTDFLRCARRKTNLEIIETDFKKCNISNAFDDTEYDVVWGAEDDCEAPVEDEFFESSEEDPLSSEI
nr:uncharacterized protein LOC129385250 [Dermacentor andersoni]